MNWILASIFLIIGSCILYLFIRNIEKYNTPIEIKNFSFFFAPIIPLYLYNYFNNISIIIEFKYFVLLLFSSVFLSWMANIASLKAMQLSPNPGYPLMISKSYVVYTTIFSYLFLGSELSLKKSVIIIFVIIFSTLIIYNKDKTRKSKDNKWILYTIYSFLAWGNLAIVLTYLTQKGIASTTINFYLCLIVSIIIIFEIFLKKTRYKIKNKFELLNLFIIGIGYIIFQQSMVYGYGVSPNPGYINAANTASIGIITLLAGLFFKDDLSKKNLIGVFGIIICLVLLFVL
ncbi:MAG: hypothetical protein PHN31_03900 [Candidatus Gracilibacteria bacterium]|nr:hypothetical protein [Candidatus Gracilibacteria bacterium]